MKQREMTLDAYKLAAIQNIANAKSLEDIYFTMTELQAQMSRKWEEDTDTSLLPRYTIEELNERIDRAEAEFEAGEYYTCEEVHQYIEERLPCLK